MLAAPVTPLNFRQHIVDIAYGELMLCGFTNGFEFLAETLRRFPPVRQIECLPDPFSDGHAPRARCTLNFPVLGILENDLQPFSHVMSLSYSWL